MGGWTVAELSLQANPGPTALAIGSNNFQHGHGLLTQSHPLGGPLLVQWRAGPGERGSGTASTPSPSDLVTFRHLFFVPTPHFHNRAVRKAGSRFRSARGKRSMRCRSAASNEVKARSQTTVTFTICPLMLVGDRRCRRPRPLAWCRWWSVTAGDALKGCSDAG